MSLNDATDAWIKRESYRRMIYQSRVSSVDRLTDFWGHVAAIIGEEARAESEPPLVVKPEAVEQIRACLGLLEKFVEEGLEGIRRLLRKGTHHKRATAMVM